MAAGSSAWKASLRRAPTPGQSNVLCRVCAPAPRHAARERGSVILRATTRGAGGRSGPLASTSRRHPGGVLWRGAGCAALSEDVRPDTDASRGTSRAVAVQVPGTRGVARRGRWGRSGRGRTIARPRGAAGEPRANACVEETGRGGGAGLGAAARPEMVCGSPAGCEDDGAGRSDGSVNRLHAGMLCSAPPQAHWRPPGARTGGPHGRRRALGAWQGPYLELVKSS